MADWIDHLIADAGVVELRHQDAQDRWTAGLFGDAAALRTAATARAGSGNLYTTVNAPAGVRASNRMRRGQFLRDADMGHHVRLLFDFDPARPKGHPSTDRELGAATAARDRLVHALSALGWPAPVTAVSGNGAHAVYRCRIAVSAETKDMLRVLYAGLAADFSIIEAVDFDVTVRNPARIWRLYGFINRKGTPMPGRPHRVAQVTIPQVWRPVSAHAVAGLANACARRNARPAPAARPVAPAPRGQGDYSTLDVVRWFQARGLYRRHLDGDRHAVHCPWAHEHSSDDPPHSTATVIWEASGRLWPNFHCSHAHCAGRTVIDVMQALGDADAYCTRRYTREAA